MRLTRYYIQNKKFSKTYTLALISDLHGSDWHEPLALLEQAMPDYILAAGDIFEPLDGRNDAINEGGFSLLEGASAIAPTFFSEGNHENGGVRSWSLKWKLAGEKQRNYTQANVERLAKTGAVFLDNGFMCKDGIAFGGLNSGLIRADGHPDVGFLQDFCKIEAPKVLLCHHPEYYPKFLKDLPIDLVVSGHAHGGQWRFFGRGVFAPGQGIFPKYTKGVYDNKLVVGTGMKPSGHIPRLFNEPEVVLITVSPREKKEKEQSV